MSAAPQPVLLSQLTHSQKVPGAGVWAAGALHFIMVVVTGRLLSKTSRSGCVAISIDDGTDVLECRLWGDQAQAIESVALDSYLRVTGVWRAADSVHLKVTCFKPVTSASQVILHFLQCAQVYLGSIQQQT
ncbi:hypothetical protein GGG16DRAFT_107070, partial [Schizophyllum commune]